MIGDVNMNAAYWLVTYYNTFWVPTMYIDGGHTVVVGTSAGFEAFTDAIEAAGAREVVPLDLELSVEWLGDAVMNIHVMLRQEPSNTAPDPAVPTGSDLAVTHNEYSCSSIAVDSENDRLYLMWDFGDEVTDWQGPYDSGEEVTVEHTWADFGIYDVRVKAKDTVDAESEWSSGLSVDVKLCGDTDPSDVIDIDDVVYLITYIFSGGTEPVPYESGDADCSGDVDIDDVVYLIAYIFSGGPEPCSDCP
jgi:hypothetical protein